MLNLMSLKAMATHIPKERLHVQRRIWHFSLQLVRLALMAMVWCVEERWLRYWTKAVQDGVARRFRCCERSCENGWCQERREEMEADDLLWWPLKGTAGIRSWQWNKDELLHMIVSCFCVVLYIMKNQVGAIKSSQKWCIPGDAVFVRTLHTLQKSTT